MGAALELGSGQRLEGFRAAWWRQLNCFEQTVSRNLNVRIISSADLEGREETFLEEGGAGYRGTGISEKLSLAVMREAELVSDDLGDLTEGIARQCVGSPVGFPLAAYNTQKERDKLGE